MKTSESRLWKTIEKNLKRYGIFTRIENSAGVGTPDVYACVRGVSAWIELKQVDGLKVGMRPEQIDFLERLSFHGGYGYVLARKNQSIRIWEGGQAGHIAKRGGWHGAVPIGEWVPPYDYKSMIACMFQKGESFTTAEYLRYMFHSVTVRRNYLEKIGVPRNECPGCFEKIYGDESKMGWCEKCRTGDTMIP